MCPRRRIRASEPRGFPDTGRRPGRRAKGDGVRASVWGAGLAVAFAVAVAATAGDATARGAQGPPTAEDSGYVEIDGADLFYRTMGQGPPILVLHGGPSIGHEYLVDGLRPLADRYRLIFFDQRGIGRSTGSADSSRLTVSRYLDDIESMRLTLAGEPVVVLGHSWGGALALSYAIDRPEAVRALVLVDPTEPGSRFRARRDENLARATTAVDSTELARLFASDGYAAGDPEVVEDIYRTIYRPWLGDRSAVVRFHFGLDLEAALRGRAVGARVVASDAGLARWADLERLIVPTLIVHGEEDPIPVEMARRLASQIDGARLEVLEGVGHFPMIERPERLRAILRDYLDAHAR